MLPEAWDVEHNYKHHFELGEGSDPGLLEHDAHNVRTPLHIDGQTVHHKAIPSTLNTSTPQHSTLDPEP